MTRDNRQVWKELQQTALDHGFLYIEVVQWKANPRGGKYPSTAYVLYRKTPEGGRVRIGRRGSVEGAGTMLRSAIRTVAESRSAPR